MKNFITIVSLQNVKKSFLNKEVYINVHYVCCFENIKVTNKILTGNYSNISILDYYSLLNQKPNFVKTS